MKNGKLKPERLLANMKEVQIKKELERIIKNIQKWQGKLEILQEKCPHENVEKEFGCGDCDDYDRVYWVRIKCNVCGYWKSFHSDTEGVEYRRWCSK